jgi:hypothetical protein
MAKYSRRDILRQFTCGGLLVSLPASVLVQPAENLTAAPLVSRLSRFYSNRESAQVIGRRYLDLAPSEADLERLMALICHSDENSARFAHANTEQLREILLDQQRTDFARGRTVMIDGWVLSETEVRLCALAAIA